MLIIFKVLRVSSFSSDADCFKYICYSLNTHADYFKYIDYSLSRHSDYFRYIDYMLMILKLKLW